MSAAGRAGALLSARMRVWSGRLGGPRFATATLLDALGSGTVMPLSVLFFTLHQHMRPTTVGIGISIGGAVTLMLTPLGGQIVDALGPRRAVLGGWLLSAISAVSWVFVHDLIALAIVQSATNIFSGIGWNATATLLTGLAEDSEVSTVMATHYSLRNFGYGAGGLLSVLALGVGGVGYDIAVYLNAASFLTAAALAAGVALPNRPAVRHPDDSTTIWTVLTDWRYVSLALLGSLIAFNQTGLQVILPLWVVLHTHAPKEIVGLLFTLNTLMVVTCQLWFSDHVTGLADAPRAYRWGAVAMIAAAGAYSAAHGVGAVPAVGLLVLGTVLMTTTEMWSSAAQFVVSLRLARPEHRGKYLAVYGMGWGVENTVGPTAGTGLAAAGLLVAWPVTALAVTVGSLASAALVRDATSQSSVSEEPPRAAVR